MSKTIKKVIIILIIIVLIVIGASFFVGENNSKSNGSSLQSVTTGGDAAPLTQIATTNAALMDTEEINREFISMLLNLQTIRLSDDIFSESAFSVLMDNTVRLNQPGNEGRPNPFAPIGTDSLSGNSELGASIGSFNDTVIINESEATVTTPTQTEGVNLEGVTSSEDLTDDQLQEVLSTLGSS